MAKKKISVGPKGQITVEKKPNKQQKFIAKISKDGKISKKEGKKAAKKDISLIKIQNRNIGDYRQSVRDFDRRGGADRTPAAQRPTFEPLKIKRGAVAADRQRDSGRTRGGRRDNDRRRSRTGGGSGGGVDVTATTSYQDEITSLTQNLQKQLDTLSTGTAAAIKKGLKQQQVSANKATRQQLAAANKNARADRRQFNKYKKQSAAAAAAAQKQYEQQLDIFNRNLLAQEEEALAQQEAFAQAMLAREQEAEQYRLNQEKLAADFAEQQRLAAENRMIGERTFMSNQMRAASADPRLKIGTQSPSGQTYGTSQFKRRQDLRPILFQGIQPAAASTIGGINI